MIKGAFLLLSILFLTASETTLSQDLERKDIDLKYKWNLEDLYKSKEDWLADKDKISSQIDNVVSYQGKLGNSANDLFNGLKSYATLLKNYYRFASYSNMMRDED